MWCVTPARYGLPQVPTTGYHELPNDWLLRDGTTYIEDRDLGARRARAAILMETRPAGLGVRVSGRGARPS